MSVKLEDAQKNLHTIVDRFVEHWKTRRVEAPGHWPNELASNDSWLDQFEAYIHLHEKKPS